MKFIPTPIDGAWIVDIEPVQDDRGFFAPMYNQEVFQQQGAPLDAPQVNMASNRARGTLRGMHYQSPPYEESKLIYCMAGAVFDVIVDIRPQSPSRGQWFGVTLDAQNHRGLFAPPGCAHGYISLTDDSAMFYIMNSTYAPGAAMGVRWDDPRIGIEWPIAPLIISERDRQWPDWQG